MSASIVDSLPLFGPAEPRPDLAPERLRIAIGVNDTVIRHLFSIGLSLHTTRTMVPDLAQLRLDATIDEIDSAISELRSLIFDLERRPGLPISP